MPESRTFLIALALFCASTISSVTCYARMLIERRGVNTIIEEFPLGESHYLFSNSGICFGSLMMSTRENIGEITIDGNGQLRITWQGQAIPLKAEIHAEFNALRQLGGSYLKFSTEKSVLMLSTLNVRPISVKVHWEDRGEVMETETSVPGPVLISKTPQGGYVIGGQVHQASRQGLQLVANQPLLKTLSVERMSGPHEIDARCPADEIHSLNLDPLAIFLREISNSVPVHLP